jgi:hypothetical protein
VSVPQTSHLFVNKMCSIQMPYEKQIHIDNLEEKTRPSSNDIASIFQQIMLCNYMIKGQCARKCYMWIILAVVIDCMSR